MILVTSSLCCSHCQVQTGKVGHGYFPPPQSNIRNPNQSIGTNLLISIAWPFHSLHFCFHAQKLLQAVCLLQALVTIVCIRLNRTKPSADAGFIQDDTKTSTVPDAAEARCLLLDCIFCHCICSSVTAGLHVSCFQSFTFSGKYS